MTTAILALVAFAVGARLRRPAALWAPTIAGALILTFLALTGHSVADTPIPFFIVLATLAMMLGRLLPPRRRAHSVAPPEALP